MASSFDQHPLPSTPGTSGALDPYREAALSELLLARREAAQGQDRIELQTIWRMLVRRRRMIVGLALLCALAAAAYTLRLTPRYESTVLLQIDRAAQKVVGFNTEFEVDEGPLSEQLQLRTQVELLKSRSLAERVIDEMGLNNSTAPGGSDGTAQAASDRAAGDAAVPPMASVDQAVAWLRQGWRNLRALMAPPSTHLNTPTRTGAVAQFQQALSVEPLRNSRLVRITVSDADPERAADFANTTARAFLATHIERKLESSLYARQYLEDQIRQTKAKLEDSERIINSYAKKNQILNLGDKGSAATQTFVDFSTALARAEQDRIKAETLYNQVKLNPESAPQAVVNEAIRAYKEQRARLEADYARNRSVFKPDYPAMVQARAQIAELDARIRTEVNNILSSIQAQYIAAKRAEERLRDKVASSRQEVLSVQDRSVDMNLLSRELDTNRQVYDSLLQRLKEVSVTAGLTTHNVSIVDRASVPLMPASPDMKVNVGLGLLIGLFLGLMGALLREQLDDSIRSASEIESRFHLPLLGLIPFTRPPRGRKGPLALLAQREPRSTFAEAYRSIRTALQFCTAEGAPQRLLVTSCGESEGKSTTALALAINFTQLGQKVLLIDADMRKGSLHRMLDVPTEGGLSFLLGEGIETEGLIRETAVSGLSVITAGPVPIDPVELLMGPRLGALLERAQALGFQQVVIDGPPLLGIADAIVLGNQVPDIVLAVRAGSTRRDSIRDALRRLRTAGLTPIGVVLTHARNEHASDPAFASYYGHGYGRDDRPAPRASRPRSLPSPDSPRIEPTLGPEPAGGA